MNIGENILNLRKKNNLSQEQLAEKLGVTRQTISNWELGESSPDLKQSTELSKIFNASLDELVGNDIKNLVIEKVSNTEKLAGIIIKILKIIGIAFIVFFIIDIVAFILYVSTGNVTKVESSATIICKMENNQYEIEVGTNKYFRCEKCSNKMNKEIKELVDFNDVDYSMEKIENYFKSNNGNCE